MYVNQDTQVQIAPLRSVVMERRLPQLTLLPSRLVYVLLDGRWIITELVRYVLLDMQVPTVYQTMDIVIARNWEVMEYLQLEFIQPLHLVIVG